MKRILFLIIAAAMLAAPAADAKRMSDLKIYINPGHGGYGSDDRPIHIYPFEKNDTASYWESKSNLYKGLHMYHILDSLGATAYLSRVKNTEDDDRSLYSIDQEANELGVDLFFSIHTNAGESVNYPLMLYREDRDENGTPYPRYEGNVTLSEILGKNLYSKEIANYTHNYRVSGDLTFGMYTTGYGILRNLFVVGVLSEGAMHEHRPEAYRMMNDDYLWLDAWHFVKTVMDYFDTEDRFVTGNVAGIVYDDHNLREKDIPVKFSTTGRDKYATVNGCYVELLDKDGNVVQKRTTDNLFNGVYVFRNVAPGTYTVRTTHEEYYDYETTVEVVADQVTYNDIALSMRREFPLEAKVIYPASNDKPVSCATILEFEFNSDIDTESFEKAFSIVPACEGYFTYYNNNHNVSFTPATAFDRNTDYTVTISTEVKHPDSRYANPNLAQPLMFNFSTESRDRMTLVDQFPADGGEVHFESPTIEFRFDNLVENSTIYDQLTIKDSKGKEVGVNKRGSKFNKLSNGYGNAVIAMGSDLTVGETYSVVLGADARDKEQLPMGTEVKFSFTATDETQNEGEMTLVMGFEGEPPFEYSAENSTGVATATPTCAKYSSNKLFDKFSARFGYTFADNRNGSIVWKYTGEALPLEAGDELGMYVNGDFNNHELYIGVTAGTDTKWIKVCDLNFLGWRYVKVSLAELDASFSYMFDGFMLNQVQSIITQKGNFCLDNLSHKSASGIEDVVIDNNSPVEYFNLQGIRVANPESGIYIRRQGNTATKVVIE